MKERDTDFMRDNYLDGMKRLVSISKRNTVSHPADTTHKEESPRIPAKYICLVCGYMWDTDPEKKEGPKKCPACSSVLWNNVDLKRYKCKQCSHMWMSKLDNPLVCPACRSKLWNKEIERFKCRSCGNVWSHMANRNAPKKCPSCKSEDLMQELVECICKRCGYCGKMRSDRISRCPVCMTILSVYSGVQGYNKEGRTSKKKENKASNVISPEALTIIRSNIDDIRKIIELERKVGMETTDAEILVRFENGENPVSIARITDTSLNKVILATMPLQCFKEEERF